MNHCQVLTIKIKERCRYHCYVVEKYRFNEPSYTCKLFELFTISPLSLNLFACPLLVFLL